MSNPVAIDSNNTIKDSGQRRSFPTGAVRDRPEGKGRFDLLPPDGIRELAIHFENGARKYGDNNWRKGIYLSVYIDSGLRHIFKTLGGEHDERHDRAAAWNLLCFLDTAERIRRGDLPAMLDDIGWLNLPRNTSESSQPAPATEPISDS